MRNLAALPGDVQEFLRRRELLIVAKTDRRATVHRNAHMDAIAIRRFGPDGAVAGLRLLIGLFTSGKIAIYCFVSCGLFCSVMWPCIFSLSTAGVALNGDPIIASGGELGPIYY